MQAVRPTVRAVARPCLTARASPLKACQHAVRQLKEAPASKPALMVAVTNLIMAMPAQAEGKLFDFDATLPIMIGQFLLLMVFLDKFWFSPVGKVLDARDKEIRDKLASVKGNTSEIEKMQEEAERKVKEARDKVNTKIAEAKKKAEEEAEEEEQKLQKQLDQELESALKELEKEREGAEKDLEQQIDTLSSNILEQMLPPDKEPAAA